MTRRSLKPSTKTKVLRWTAGFLIMVAGVLLLVTSAAVVLPLAGCGHQDSLADTFRIPEMIPYDILYKGWTYAATGQIVGRTEYAPADLSFVGSATAVGDMTPDTSVESGYEIFAIKRVDPDKAIAVKFLGVSRKGAEWVWLR